MVTVQWRFLLFDVIKFIRRSIFLKTSQDFFWWGHVLHVENSRYVNFHLVLKACLNLFRCFLPARMNLHSRNRHLSQVHLWNQVQNYCVTKVASHHSSSIQWVSSNLSWFASLNNKAFGNLFCNPEKSFHTSPRSSDSNNRGYRPFFKLNNGICIYKKS